MIYLKIGFQKKNIDLKKLHDIVLNHHQQELERYNFSDNITKILSAIVCESDSLSSGEREKFNADVEDYLGENTPLLSLLPNIFNPDAKDRFYYSTNKLNIDFETIYPKQNTLSEYSRIYNEFITEFNQFLNKFKDFNIQKIDTLLELLKKYLWAVPSAYYKTEPDISLYEHLRMTTAISVCIYKSVETELNEDFNYKDIFDRTKKRFRLVCGDVSGIQNYIYSIASEKAAKSLKGRSFYIQLLSDTISDLIISEFNLPKCNLIYSAGGKFYCLIPETKKTEQQLKELNIKINEFLLDKFSGKIYLALGSVKLNGNDFCKDNSGEYNISDKWRLVNIETGKEKSNKFSDLLKTSDNIDKYYDKIFGPFEQAGKKPFCKICSKEIDADGICNECSEKIDLGKTLRQSSVLVQFKINQLSDFDENFYLNLNQEGLVDFNQLGYIYYFTKSIKEISDTLEKYQSNFSEIRIFNINHPDNFMFNLLSLDNVGTGFKFIGLGETKKHFDIHEICRDKNNNLSRLGILRMDIDNLGNIFVKGLGKKNTISRITQLSFYLDYYFTGVLNKIVSKYQDVHIIYSGGDDLFLVGRWDEIIFVALDIYNDFNRFTKNNKITISGGIYLAREKYPIYKSAEKSGNFEDASKSYEINGVSKNAITLLNKTFNFNDFEKIYDIVKVLIKNVGDDSDKKLTKGFLNKLFSIYSMDKEEEQKLKQNKMLSVVTRYRWKWLMAYNFSRYIKERFKDNAHLKDLVKSFENYILTDEFIFNDLNFKTMVNGIESIGLVSRLSQLLLRKKN